MSFHSVKCVYLESSESHKGFKCLSSIGKMYVSTHVIFNEMEFPFKNGFLNTRKPEQTSIEVIHMFPIIPRQDNDVENESTNGCSSVQCPSD